MWLFGSLARGDWDACSDVDLLALSQEGRQQLMQGLQLQGLAEMHLKALTRMNSASRSPQGDAAPADLFDANDSTTALGTAEAEVRIAMGQLQA